MANHVLLIEDEPNIMEAIRFILSRDGWKVTCHADGATAMAAIQRALPDVVVLAHPECPPEVVELADFSGSTTALVKTPADWVWQPASSTAPAMATKGANPPDFIGRIQLQEHLSPTRSNGLGAMITRIRQLAAENA